MTKAKKKKRMRRKNEVGIHSMCLQISTLKILTRRKPFIGQGLVTANGIHVGLSGQKENATLPKY